MQPQGKAPNARVQGLLAIKDQLDETKALFDSGKRGKDMMMRLKPLKTYRWALTEEDHQTFREMAMALGRDIESMAKAGTLELQDGEDVNEAIVEFNGLASSSTNPIPKTTVPAKKTEGCG